MTSSGPEERIAATRPAAIPSEVPAAEEPVADAPAAEEPVAEEPADWAWVSEWRAGREPVPWGPGIAVAAFTALIVGSAVYVLSAGLADRPWLAVLVNVVVAAGVAPAMWLSRGLPVLRWIAAGAVGGVVLGWLSALLFLTGQVP